MHSGGKRGRGVALVHLGMGAASGTPLPARAGTALELASAPFVFRHGEHF